MIDDRVTPRTNAHVLLALILILIFTDVTNLLRRSTILILLDRLLIALHQAVEARGRKSEWLAIRLLTAAIGSKISVVVLSSS